MNSVHAASPQPSPKPSSLRSSAEPGVEAQAVMKKRRAFECDICYEPCLSQTELDDHVVTVHSCPICHDGIYMDMRALGEHLEQHCSPYACYSCGLAYAEEDQLLEHYRDSQNDVHPYCEKCHFGFENDDAYTAVSITLDEGESESTNWGSQHVNETHPLVACHVCEDVFFDQERLALHYLSSPKHPKCEKCGIGFRDQFDYTDVSDQIRHCFSFDLESCSMVLLHTPSVIVICANGILTPQISCRIISTIFSIIQNAKIATSGLLTRMRTNTCDSELWHEWFSAYPASTFQHLFIVHRPGFGDQGHSDVSAVEPDREEKIPHDDLSSPPMNARAFDPIWGFEGSADLPYASFIPLPPSLSSYSSPTSQRVTAESGGSSGSRSRSSTLPVEQQSPTDGRPWNATLRSLSLDAGEYLKASPESDHSPLSTLPAVGTPHISGMPTIQSVDSDSPFSPRPEPPSLFSLSQGVNGTAVTVAEDDEADSNSSSSFTRSPPLISPVVKLPDPGAASPSSTSSWTMTSDTGSRRSSPQSRSVSSSKGISTTFSVGQTETSDHTVPQLSLLVPSSTQMTGSARSWSDFFA